MSVPRGKIIREWVIGKESEKWRLLAMGKHSAGYEDFYLVQAAETDELGADRWITKLMIEPEYGDSAIEAQIALVEAARR